jgi:hypothetical protein
MCTGSEKRRGGGVVQVMEAHAWQACAREQRPEGRAKELATVDRSAERRAEDQISVLTHDAG